MKPVGNWESWAGWSPNGRRSGGVDVSIYGVDLVRRELSAIEKDLRPFANSELRHATKDLAKRTLVPGLKQATVKAGNQYLANVIWATHIVRSDRIVNVQLGRKKPKLSGLAGKGKKGSGVANRRTWTQIAWGSEMGPKGGAKMQRPGRGGARPGANYYAQPRKATGHWVQPAVSPFSRLHREIREEYEQFLVDLMRKWK